MSSRKDLLCKMVIAVPLEKNAMIAFEVSIPRQFTAVEHMDESGLWKGLVFNRGRVPILTINAKDSHAELTRLVRFIDAKTKKRNYRRSIAAICMGIPNEKVEATLKLVDDKAYDARAQWKYSMKSALTSLTCNNTGLYEFTFDLVKYIREELVKNITLCPFMKTGQVLIIMKGGNAQKRALKRIKPDLSEIIDNVFGMDGDNDISILIDPSLSREAFCTLHKIIMDHTVTALQENRSCDSVNKINEKILALLQDSTYLPSKRRDFIIVGESGDILENGLEHEFYISRKDRYEYKAHGVAFGLIRFMRCYETNHRTYGHARLASEVLDISIPHNDDAKLNEEFNLFRSLEHAFVTGL